MTTGTIVTKVQDRGYFFIESANGERFFGHLSSLLDTDFAGLQVGDRVSFDSVVSQRGPRAENVCLVV
jgi:cold shock CspA family protein